MSVANKAETSVEVDAAVEFSVAEMSLSRRVRMTPWGDLLRGQLSGRFDVESRIAESGLPTENCVLVRNVMRRVGLWRGERVEVVEELLIHFQDGISAGVGAAALAGSFGDAKQAASLIRRSKKRLRPRSWMMLMKMFKGVGVLFACFVLWYVGALFYYFSGEVVVSHDYVAEMTAQARSVPEAERAWPVYRDAIAAMRADIDILGGLDGDTWNPQGANWAETVKFLERHQAELASIRRGAGMSGLGYVASHSNHAEDAGLWPEQAEESVDETRELFKNTVLKVRLPHLGVFRDLTRPLSGDAYLATQQGDGARVAADIRALLRVADHVRETPSIISDLVSTSAASIAFETLGDILSADASIFTTNELRVLAHELGALEAGEQGILGVRLNSDRRMMYDLMQRIYTDDGKGGGHLAPGGMRALRGITGFLSSVAGRDLGVEEAWEFSDLLVPATGLVMANRRDLRREYDHWMDRIVAEARTPLWERPLQGVETEFEMKHDDMLWKSRYFIVLALMPALSRAAMIEPRIRMLRDGVLTAVALELWRREHGGMWPADLEMLVPQYLPTLPIDQFTGATLGYSVHDGRAFIYGVGVDLDDDGGIAPAEAPEGIFYYHVEGWRHPEDVAVLKASKEQPTALSLAYRVPDGDWILWESGGEEE